MRDFRIKCGDANYHTMPLDYPGLDILHWFLSNKQEDLGSFVIPCSIDGLGPRRALADPGLSVNIMSLTTYLLVISEKPQPTIIRLGLVDQSHIYPVGIVNDVLVMVGNFLYTIDFVIVGKEDDPGTPLLFGSPFSTTTTVVIDCVDGRETLRYEEHKEVYGVRTSVLKLIECMSGP
ncbi:uncharacterized protein Tco_0764626 [Tanacetum coccineum]